MQAESRLRSVQRTKPLSFPAKSPLIAFDEAEARVANSPKNEATWRVCKGMSKRERLEELLQVWRTGFVDATEEVGMAFSLSFFFFKKNADAQRHAARSGS